MDGKIRNCVWKLYNEIQGNFLWSKIIRFHFFPNILIERLSNYCHDYMVTDNSKKIQLIVYVAGGGGALLLVILIVVIVVFVVSRRRWVFCRKWGVFNFTLRLGLDFIKMGAKISYCLYLKYDERYTFMCVKLGEVKRV